MTITSSSLTATAFLFNLGAIFLLVRMLPYGVTIDVWYKILLAFLLTTGEVLACAAAFYAYKENQSSRTTKELPGRN
jgi:hypothetical protein